MSAPYCTNQIDLKVIERCADDLSPNLGTRLAGKRRTAVEFIVFPIPKPLKLT